MPAQKRALSENRDDDDDEEFLQHFRKQSRHEREAQAEEVVEEEEEEEAEEEQEEEEEEDDDDDDREDSRGIPSPTCEEKPEFVFVELPDIRKDVQCPICLGIIKKTRTVMECLHRFCRECIDKSMRMGNNECPACRTHCASRRSLRDDPNYDALIAALYPDIDKYEEEELAFHEEERNRNKQIQESIAQIFQRQSEALVKRRTPAKDTTGALILRSQRNCRNTPSRRRHNHTGPELQGYDDNGDENDNDEGKDSSSTDERCAEVKRRRYRRRARNRPSQPSSSAANSDVGCIENDLEVSRESRGISPGGPVWNTEMLAWGRGGARSHTRHGSVNGSSKSARTTRLSRLVDYLRSLEENDAELDVHLTLTSLNKQSAPNLQQLHLCCRPSLSVKHLCEYVALQTPMRSEEVEILVVKGCHNSNDGQPTLCPSTSKNDPNPTMPQLVDSGKDDLQILEEQVTLAGLKANYTSGRNHLILAYRQKETTSANLR